MYSLMSVNFYISAGFSFSFISICWKVLNIVCESDLAFFAIISIKFLVRVWNFSDKNYLISLQLISKTETWMFYGNFSRMFFYFTIVEAISAWICSNYHALSSIYIFLVNSSGSIFKSVEYSSHDFLYSRSGSKVLSIFYSTYLIKYQIHLF